MHVLPVRQGAALAIGSSGGGALLDDEAGRGWMGIASCRPRLQLWYPGDVTQQMPIVPVAAVRVPEAD